jgi:hypothetical protein
MVEKGELAQGGRIQDWAMAARKHGELQLGARLNLDRLEGFNALERLSLPRYKQATLPLPDFLKHPDEHFDNIGSEKFWINLPPKRQELQRYRQINLERAGIIEFINEHVPDASHFEYNIHLSEYFDNIFSGNIVINSAGDVVGEMVTGVQSPLATGEKTPEFTMKRDPFTKIFKYSFEEESLRRAMWKTMLAIPHDGEGRELECTPGYYEFVLIKRDEQAPLEPIFLDYSNSPIYQIKS